MKASELRQIIREEIRNVLKEDSTTLMTLEDALATKPDYSIIAIHNKFKGDGKDIIISKAPRDNYAARDKLAARGYMPIAIGKAFNAYATSIEDIQARIDVIQNTPNYKIDDTDLKSWKRDPVKTYLTTGINYDVIDKSKPRDSNLGMFGILGGSQRRPTPLYIDNNVMNIMGNGKLIGFIFGVTHKSLIPTK
jgi:hypothetical protein